MQLRKKALLVLLTCTLLYIKPLAQVEAQTPATIQVNYQDCDDQPEALICALYVTILDENGRPLPDLRLESQAVAQIIGGEAYLGQVEKLETTFFIFIILDTSGSMRNDVAAMKAAARAAIGNAPQGAHVAVATFDEPEEPGRTLTLLQGFTPDLEQVKQAIDAVQITGSRGTCLYDAAYEAADRVDQQIRQQPGTRGAVVLFTDGRDELISGQPQNPCSRHTVEQLIELARSHSTPVQLHTIGLGQDIDVAILNRMSDSTGGRSVTGEQADLPAMFQHIMDGLRSQWLVQLPLALPLAGNYTVTLFLTISQDASLSTIFHVESQVNREISLEIANFRPDPEAKTYTFDVVWQGQIPEDSRFHVEILDGNDVQADSFFHLVTADSITYEATNLKSGDYFLRVSIQFDEPSTARNVVPGVQRFRHDPPLSPTQTPAPLPAVEITSVSRSENEEICLNLLWQHAERVASYTLEVKQEGNRVGELVHGEQSSSQVCLPFALSGGVYDFTLTTYGPDGTLFTPATYRYEFVPSPGPGIVEILSQNLAILGTIIVILLVVVGWLMWRPYLSRRSAIPDYLGGSTPPARRETGLPLDRTEVFQPEMHLTDRTIIAPPEESVIGRLRVEKSPDLNQQGREIEIRTVPFTIGRRDCNLTINDGYLSSQHAEIVLLGDTLYLRDLNSSNGTFVSQQRLRANMPCPLSSSAAVAIRLGPETELAFVIHDPDGKTVMTHSAGNS
jgi:hypothetical protein